MNKYHVHIEGINVPTELITQTITMGFITTRFIEAASEQEAEEKAVCNYKKPTTFITHTSVI